VSPQVRVIEWSGWPALALGDDDVEVVVLPSRGAKLASVRSVRSGREWLWSDPSRPIRPARLGDAYAEHDISGWDECFPSIGPCVHPDLGISIADHGEVWSQPWTVWCDGSSVTTTIRGTSLPFELTRRLQFVGPGRFELAYRLTNVGDHGFSWTWSSHPLLAAEHAMRIELPCASPLRVEYDPTGLLSESREAEASLGGHRWPIVPTWHGEALDLRRLDFARPLPIIKVVADTPSAGWIAVISPDGRERLAMELDPKVLPYIGICVNIGAWPETGKPGSWIAVEPANSPTDRLDDAVATGHGWYLPAGNAATWEMRVGLEAPAWP
jgi:hypothetical protein